MIRSVAHRLCLVTLGAQVVGAVVGVIFYARLARAVIAAHHGQQLGLDGLALAGYAIAVFVCCAFAMASASAFAISLWRVPLWRVVAPVPALLATAGFGAWLQSGDAGDEHWVRFALVFEAGALFVAVVAALMGFPKQAGRSASAAPTERS